MGKATPRRNHLQEEQHARTRALILQAALQIFSTNGYVDSSIGQILTCADVSRAAFYSHFDGKLAIVQAIAADYEPQWHPVFHHLADLRDPGMPELIEWASRHLTLHRSNLEICTLLTQVTALEESLYWQVSRQRDALIDMLADHHPAFAAAKVNSEILLEARILLWTVDQTCFHIVRQHLPDPDSTAAKIIASQMLHFLESHGTHRNPKSPTMDG